MGNIVGMSIPKNDDRYMRAVKALVNNGKTVSLRSVRAWLVEKDGIGCSLRDAQVAVSAWRDGRTNKVSATVRKVRTTVSKALKPLDSDTQQRVVKELTSSDWLKVTT